MEVNSLQLTGVLLKKQEVVNSPAGIPHQMLMLRHRSRQPHSEGDQIVEIDTKAKLVGGKLVSVLSGVESGARLRLDGFLTTQSYQDKELMVQVSTIELLD